MEDVLLHRETRNTCGSCTQAKENRDLASYQNAHGKMGLAEFLYAREVSGKERASCTCGWRQNVKHLLFYLERSTRDAGGG